jgi:late competence protein required for DNA uptake (superfamily II DNA/RNA helicase)
MSRSKCDRCGKESFITTMSMFNTEMCCQSCIMKEKKHPNYPIARQKEHEATKRGDYNFPGIGLPPDYIV